MFKKIEIDDLNSLRFADEIVLISDSFGKVEQLLRKSASQKLALKSIPLKLSS